MVSLSDFFYSLIFIAYIFYLRYSLNKLGENRDIFNIDTKDYAIKVSDFPETLKDEEVIVNHFNGLLKNCVAEVKFARNYYGTLLNHKKLAEYETSLEVLEK